jgi:hypothetical protein
VVDPEAALGPDAPLLFDDHGSNQAMEIPTEHRVDLEADRAT